MSSGDYAASNYRGNKRAACDRCRDFKLRCPPREAGDGTPESGKCARCAKAGAVCNFSTSLRSSRPVSKCPSKQRRTSDPNHASRFNPSDLAVPWGALTEDSREYDFHATNHENDLEPLPCLNYSTLGGTLEEAAGPTSLHTPLTKHDSHGAQFLESFPANEVGSMFDGEQLDFWNHPGPTTMPQVDRGVKSTMNDPYSMDPERYVRHYNWGLDNPIYSSNTREVSQGQDPTSVGESSTPTLLTPLEVRMVEASRMATEQRRKHWQPNNDGRVGPTGELLRHLQARSQAQKTGFDRTTPNSASSETTVDKFPESLPVCSSPSTTTQDIQYRRIQELSELSLRFYSQAKDITSHGEANPLALNQPNNLAVKVLESSMTFRNLLISLYPLHPPSPSTDHPSSSSDEDMPSISQESPASSQQQQQQQQRRKRSHCSSSEEASDDKPHPSPPVDMAEIFALLTCYIRILHLHHLFYSRLSSFLTPLFQTGAHLPPPFPRTQAGSVSLDGFAKFQVKLLVQVSTHILGEIEIALGLPDGYRISEKDRAGIFEGTVSVQFIEMTMREEAKSFLGAERDKVASIRDHLGRLRRLLKGTIDP